NAYTGELLEILSVRPGITDWASIWNADEGGVLAGAKDPDKAFEVLIQPTKLQLQLRYVRTQTLWSDIKIIFYTVRRIADSSYYPAERADAQRLHRGMGATVNCPPARIPRRLVPPPQGHDNSIRYAHGPVLQLPRRLHGHREGAVRYHARRGVA